MRIVAGLMIWVACLVVAAWSLLAMPVSALLGSGKRAWRLAVSYDQLGNATAGGDEDEVFSSRCWRMRDRLHYRIMMRVVDWIFLKLANEKNHCLNAYIGEEKKRQNRPNSSKDNYPINRKIE